MKKRMFILFAGVLVIGIEGFYVFSDQWLRYVFAHAGGLGIMGFLGMLAGAIAARKGYNYTRALGLGFALPIMLGILAVLVVHGSGGNGCGGIVSLAASFLVIAFYGFAKGKTAG